MKILKLLSKKFFFIFFFLISLSSYSDEKPVDIWEINKKKAQEENKLKDSEIKVEEIQRKNQFQIFMKCRHQKKMILLNLNQI